MTALPGYISEYRAGELRLTLGTDGNGCDDGGGESGGYGGWHPGTQTARVDEYRRLCWTDHVYADAKKRTMLGQSKNSLKRCVRVQTIH